MKSFNRWLLVVLFAWVSLMPTNGLAQNQDLSPKPQDFLLIEMLLSMQGAVIGGGLGVLGVGQVLETGWSCSALALEEVPNCQLVQSFQSLCLGSALGIPTGATFLGIGLAEVMLDTEGNIWGALLGSMVGELIGVPQCSLINFLQDLGFSISFNAITDSDLSLLVNPIVLSAFGATVGYNFDLILGGMSGSSGVAFTVPLFHWRF